MADSKIILSKDLMDKVIEELTEYRAIGTVEEFKALKEKSVAKKPIKHGSYYVCPCCGNTEIEYCNEVDCRTIDLNVAYCADRNWIGNKRRRI